MAGVTGTDSQARHHPRPAVEVSTPLVRSIHARLKRHYAWPLAGPAADLALLLPASALVTTDRLYAVAGLLLALFWCLRLPRLAATRADLLLNLLLLSFSAWVIAIYATQLRGPATTFALWGLLLHLAVVRAAADWPWSAARRSWLPGIALAAGGAVLAVLALFSVTWKYYPGDSHFGHYERGLLPGPVMNWIHGLPRLVNSVQSSHGLQSGLSANEIAGTLALLLFIPIAWLLFRSAGWWSVAAALAAAVIVFFELAAGSWSALAGIAVGGGVLVLLRFRRAALIAAAVLLAGAVVLSPLLLSRGRHLWETNASLALRKDKWHRGLIYAGERPWTGIGINEFANRYAADLEAAHGEPDPPHVHDFYLQLWLDLGLPGVLLFLALLGFAARGALIGWRALRPGDRWLLAGLIAGCVAGLTFGVTDAVAPGAKAGLLFWLVLGLIIAAAEARGAGVVPRRGAAAIGARAGGSAPEKERGCPR